MTLVSITQALEQLDSVLEGDLSKATIELWDGDEKEFHVYRYVQVRDQYPHCQWVKDVNVASG